MQIFFERLFNQDDLVYIKHVDASFYSLNADSKTLHACRLKAQSEAMKHAREINTNLVPNNEKS